MKKLEPQFGEENPAAHTRGFPYLGDIGKPGRLRASHLLYLLSISHSTLYAGMAAGRYPKPDGKDGRRPYWLTATIRPLLTK